MNAYVLKQLFPYAYASENAKTPGSVEVANLSVRVTDLRDRIDEDGDRVHFRELGEVKNPFAPLSEQKSYQGDAAALLAARPQVNMVKAREHCVNLPYR